MLSPILGSKRIRSDLLLEEKWAIVAYSTMFRENGDGRLVNNSRKMLTLRFRCSERAIANVLRDYDQQIADGVIVPDLTPSNRHN
jgi:hypothetical protein